MTKSEQSLNVIQIMALGSGARLPYKGILDINDDFLRDASPGSYEKLLSRIVRDKIHG